MQEPTKLPTSLRRLAVVVLLLGLAMLVYWTMFLLQAIPIGEIPILPESVTALLALATGVGLLYRKPWAVPCAMVLAGMWAYGVIGGVGLVLQHGLDFESPFGAIVDAVVFPLILLFAIYMATSVWRHRAWFA